MLKLANGTWTRGVNSAYTCAAGVLRAAGQRAWSKYVITVRAMAVLREQCELLQTTIEETQLKLRDMTNDLSREQASLDSAVYDVRRMADARVQERRDRAQRMGVAFSFRGEDVLVWMSDACEMQRIEDLRAHRMRCRRLEVRVRKLQAAKQQMQKSQASLEDMIGDVELAEDFSRITEALNSANSTQLDPLITDIMEKVYKLSDAMHESETKALELNDEMSQTLDVVPEPRSRENARDVLDLIYATTDPSPAKPAAALEDQPRKSPAPLLLNAAHE